MFFDIIGESFLAVSQFPNVVHLFVMNGGSKDRSFDTCEKGLMENEES